MTNIEKANKWIDENFTDIDEKDRELFTEIYLNGLAEGYHKGIVETKELFLKNFKDNNTNE